MKPTRRSLLLAVAGIPAAACAGMSGRREAPRFRTGLAGFADDPETTHDFRKDVSVPLVLDALELWRVSASEHLMVARTRDGLEACLPTNKRFGDDLELFTGRVLPFFVGQDLRDVESIEARCARANYKIVGLPFWNAVGHMDMLALEVIGQAARRSVADVLGGARRRSVEVYLSSRDRVRTPEKEIDDFMAPRLAATGARACKLGIGGRMSRNEDAAPGRSEALVARARKVLGTGVSIAVDANGSYDAETGIATGRMLERYGVWFFEEPCPFEEFEMTRQVAEALELPIAGGEQDSSLAKWRWVIANKAVDVVQPDLFYAGGFLRSLRVSRQAASAGLDCVPHAPRAHAGAATLLQFVALLERPGRFHEFSAAAVTGKAAYDYAPVLKVEGGAIRIPDGPGFGLTYDVEGIRRRGRRQELALPAAVPEED